MKPTVYIDQNVLSYLVEGVITFPEDEFQCVYSETHFKEIPKDNKIPFLKTLDQFDAIMVRADVNEHNEILDTASFINHHPVEELMSDYENRIENFEYESIFDPLMARLAGANNYDEASSFHNQGLEKLLDQFSDDPMMEQLINPLKALFKTTTDSLKVSLKNIESIEKQRSQIGTDKGKLLQIDEINSISLIGEKIKEFIGTDLLAIVMSFLKDKSVYSKIIALNALLNHVGYNADTKLSSVEKIPNIRYDSQHMANGIFCNFLMSEDRRFIAKAKAVYEYLDVHTIEHL